MNPHGATRGQATTEPYHDASNEGQLQFIVIERPTDAKSRGYRKKVRSHVTTLQHQRARQAGPPSSREATPGSTKPPKLLKGHGVKRKQPEKEPPLVDEEVDGTVSRPDLHRGDTCSRRAACARQHAGTVILSWVTCVPDVRNR